jgi:ABC-2 type transport system ATP-binding protein
MSSIQESPALEVANLSYSYRGHWLIDSKQVLKNITLSVAKGESFGFLGHNGAGKTTTIKSILGITTIHSGSIKVFGIPHAQAEARSLIGYLPEHPYFYDHLTVTEMLEMYGTLAGIPKHDLKRACTSALDMVKLSGRSKSSLRTLSKGLVQRAGMAQAIIARPKLLILDEPFSGLDPLGRKDFKDLLSELKSTGTTIFMSSHILSDVEFLCDRVSIMSKGAIKAIYAVKDIPTLSAARFELIVEAEEKAQVLLTISAAELRQQNGKLVAIFDDRVKAQQALKSLSDQGLRIDSFNTIQNSLEDVFIKLVQFDESAGA